MRAYSKHRLIQQEIGMISNTGRNWMDRLLCSLQKSFKVNYKIAVPASTYLRMEVFCEDVSSLSEVNFNKRDLLSLLYDDFIIYVRKTDDIETIYTQLMMKYQIYTQRVPTLKPSKVKDERFRSYLYTDELKENRNLIEIVVSFERKSALRGEIVLADMDEQFPDHPFTLEKILEMLLFDFIEEYRQGNHKEVLKKVVKNLEK
jgi:hypothetical protein